MSDSLPPTVLPDRLAATANQADLAEVFQQNDSRLR
jgi:hypothetical protein